MIPEKFFGGFSQIFNAEIRAEEFLTVKFNDLPNNFADIGMESSAEPR